MGLAWSMATPAWHSHTGSEQGADAPLPLMGICISSLLCGCGTMQEGSSGCPAVGLGAAPLVLHLPSLDSLDAGLGTAQVSGHAGKAGLENLSRLPAWHSGRR